LSLFTKNTSSLRIRFALGFGILFTLILAVALIFIYVSFATFRKDEFYSRLKEKAITTYKLLVEVNRIDSSLLREIEKNTPTTAARQVMVFKDSSIIYNSSDDKKIAYDRNLFSMIKTKQEFSTVKDENEVLGLYVQKNTDHYTILAYGYDRSGFRKMDFLKWVMIIVYCIGVVIGWIATYFFVKKIIKPLDSLKNNLNSINYNNLDTHLPESGQGEEVNSLSANFNQMLARLDKSFSFQKDFVHYASHELRTPLAAMVGLTESSLNNSKTEEQFREALKQLLNQQKNLTDITTSLLLLSGNKINSNEYPLVRLDELIFRSIEIMKDLFPAAEIEMNFEGSPSNESLLLIHANEPLILMVFNNLLKNALQYSPDNKIHVIMKVTEKEKEVRFMNAGDLFLPEEKEKIFTPFFRARNSSAVKGHGLGLALVKQILHLHDAEINYYYQEEMNVFKIRFC
jgi:two-component system, OmpR family, sensor histidine kinase ArlS